MKRMWLSVLIAFNSCSFCSKVLMYRLSCLHLVLSCPRFRLFTSVTVGCTILILVLISWVSAYALVRIFPKCSSRSSMVDLNLVRKLPIPWCSLWRNIMKLFNALGLRKSSLVLGLYHVSWYHCHIILVFIGSIVQVDWVTIWSIIWEMIPIV